MTDPVLAARLVRRTGFGATGPAVDAVRAAGIPAAVDALLAADPDKDAGALATPSPGPFPAATKANGLEGSQRAELQAWWLRRMVAVAQPFGEKLTFVWHAHFATSIQKVRSAPEMLAQNERLRTLGRGDFRTLAYAMLTDAAMLKWLDGQANTAQAPNENLSREFMEVFALGHGDGYTEQDVREGARALTGWRIQPDGSTSLVPRRHDAGAKTVLGVTGPLDAAGYCDAVLAAPASPRFVAAALWSFLVSDAAPSPADLAAPVAAYGPGRDVTALLRALLTGPAFAAARGTTVASPVEWLVGALRALRTPLDSDAHVRQLIGVLRALGQEPFAPPSVGGWPAGQAWLSTAAADLRLQAASVVAQRSDLSALRGGSTTTQLDAAAQLLGVPAWTDRSAAVLRDVARDPVRLVAVALNTPENLTD